MQQTTISSIDGKIDEPVHQMMSGLDKSKKDIEMANREEKIYFRVFDKVFLIQWISFFTHASVIAGQRGRIMKL